MDIKHTLELEDGDYEVYVKASADDVEYLQRLSLTFLIEQDLFPFILLSQKNYCDFHAVPERIQ